MEFYNEKFGAEEFKCRAAEMTKVFCLPVLVHIIMYDSYAIHLLVLRDYVRYFGALDLNTRLLGSRKFDTNIHSGHSICKEAC